jgi:aspartate/methionine/tyrosine aminotransferase
VIKLVCEGAMTVSRLRDIPGIGVDKVGDAADATADPRFLRLENLDTDLRPPQVALEATHAAIDRDDANSYLPFQGHLALREAACAHVAAITGRGYDPGTQCVSVAGGLNGILNVLLATVEPGQEVVICDPVYAGLVNRIRLAGGVPRFVSCTPGPGGWATDPGELAAAIGPRTAAVLLMSPVMPTGAVLGSEHLDAIAARSAGTAPGSSGTRRWNGSGSTVSRPSIPPPIPAWLTGRSPSGRRPRNCG